MEISGHVSQEELIEKNFLMTHHKKIMMGPSENCCSGKLNTLSGPVPSTSLMPSNFVSQNKSEHVHGVYAFGLFPHPKNTKIKGQLASKAIENQQSIKYLMTVRGCA